MSRPFDNKLSPADKHMMALPVNRPGRNRLRDRLPLSGDRLAARARKYLTMADEYAARDTYARKRDEPEQPYAVRLWQLTGHLFTRRLPERLDYPDWYEGASLSTYVEKFDSRNHLKQPKAEGKGLTTDPLLCSSGKTATAASRQSLPAIGGLSMNTKTAITRIYTAEKAFRMAAFAIPEGAFNHYGKALAGIIAGCNVIGSDDKAMGIYAAQLVAALVSTKGTGIYMVPAKHEGNEGFEYHVRFVADGKAPELWAYTVEGEGENRKRKLEFKGPPADFYAKYGQPAEPKLVVTHLTTGASMGVVDAPKPKAKQRKAA